MGLVSPAAVKRTTSRAAGDRHHRASTTSTAAAATRSPIDLDDVGRARPGPPSTSGSSLLEAPAQLGGHRRWWSPTPTRPGSSGSSSRSRTSGPSRSSRGRRAGRLRPRRSGTTTTASASSTASTDEAIAVRPRRRRAAWSTRSTRQRVDELVDAILEPDAPPLGRRRGPHRGDGRAVRRRRRLVHDPDDGAAPQRRRRRRARGREPARRPTAWTRRGGTGIGERVRRRSRRLLESPSAGRRARCVEQAAALRDDLRPYV